MEDSGTLRFGLFELDLRAGELRRKGVRVKLQEQPFQVLALLLQKPGEVVTREELRERLWPADTFVDFDHSLNAAVRRLRDALGDSAENPAFVETVARRGYRFLAPVTTKTPSDSTPATPAVGHETVSGSWVRGTNWWFIAAAGAIALVFIGVKIGLVFASNHPSSPIRISQLTANPADDRVRAAAISPDGRYLAFSDETGFYLRQIDTGETHPLTLPQGMQARSIGWFPDSIHMLVALVSTGPQSSLWEISAMGGNARKLNDDGRSPAVSPDGKEIAFISGSRLHQEVWLIGADGAPPHQIAGEEGDYFGTLAWSADGTKLAFTRGRDSNAYGVNGEIDIVEVHSRHGSPIPSTVNRQILTGLDGPLAWAADDQLLYTVTEPPPNAQQSNLWSVKIGLRGKPVSDPMRLTSDAGQVFSITVTADGKRVVYLKGLPQPDVYIAKVAGTGFINEPQRLTLDDHADLPYDWTLDDKEVIFTSDRTGTLNIYKQARDQTIPELLVRDSHPLIESRLSPDASQLLYVQNPRWGEKGQSNALMRAPLSGGAPQKILEENWISNHQCARNPATICLYSVVKDRALTFFIYDPFKGKGAQFVQIEDELPQAFNWSLSPDGTLLAISKGKGDPQSRVRLISIDAAGRPAGDRWLTIAGWAIASLDWAADSRSLWAPSPGDEENTLLNIDLQGRVHAVWRPTKKTVAWAIPSRDGRSLALHVSSTSANVWMLERP